MNEIKLIEKEIKSLRKQRNAIDSNINSLESKKRRVELEQFTKSTKYKVGDNVRAERYGGIFIKGRVLGFQCGYGRPQIKVIHKRGGSERWELFNEENLELI